ncbi:MULTISPECIES: FecCD family ABC transporter permease [Paracoccaceae]|jgi:iron complex transport system permease protein|uniref:FecCD family ABC transporter permease n=1 Tax=Rhodobacterales TaxID=204455 RepID=UPI001B222FE3|nr:iron ABC transporter permease [Boseongicola sp. H5]MBO6922471.1 iron ABC transporter permease [Roseicyclus sp.]
MSETVIERLDGWVTYRLPVRALTIVTLLLLASLTVLLGALMSGSFPLTAWQSVATLFGAAPSDTATTVVWEFRFPRALVSALSGALLALSGAVLQTVTRNVLADPSLVGVSQGAGLAVVSTMIAFPQTPIALRPILAFGGALVVAALIQWIAMRRTGGATMRFILTGIGVAAFISACTQALLTYGDIDRALAALGWLAGSVHAAGWGEVAYLTLGLFAMTPVLFWAARPLAALRMGPETAAGLGAAVRRDRMILITLSVALAAFAVAAVGPLGFVGLVAPHVARRLARSGPGLHLALSAAAGALMVSAADLLGRTAFAPVQLPAGLVTAAIGAPVFVWLILRAQARSQI